MVADPQITVEHTADGVLLTITDAARLSLPLSASMAHTLATMIDTCMKTGERQTTGSVDVWRARPGAYGLHLVVNRVSWTCPAMESWAIEEIADGLEAVPLEDGKRGRTLLDELSAEVNPEDTLDNPLRRE